MTVNGPDFRQTWLWRQAFQTPRSDSTTDEQEFFKTQYLSIRERAAQLVSRIAVDLPGMTVHDISHLDALWDTASSVAEGAVNVNPAEAFVLGASLLLHDAAMSLSAYPGGLAEVRTTVAWRDAVARLALASEESGDERFDVENPPDAIVQRIVPDVLRQLHAERAEELAEQAWGAADGSQVYLVEDPDLRRFYGPTIGQIAHSHWWSVQKLDQEFSEELGALANRTCLGAQLAISVNNCPPPRDPRSRMTSFKRTQRKYVQKAYRVRNWREYETGLRARGSLTVWLGLTDGKLANWNSPRPTRRKPGRQRKYSNHAIETTVTLGLVFGLASRQTEGFLRSLLTLLNLDNDVPDHSTISRRKARLGKVASYERRTVKPVHLRIDSSGLSVHVGQLRTPPKARDYRKLHLAVDEQPSDVVACELTSKRARDASRVASLVGQIERPIASAKADAAYDTGDIYKTLENHRAHRSPKVLIPPRKGAQLALDSAGTRQRNRNIRARSRVGKRKWYVASGYSRRSKVETTFHRDKAILGSAMRARGLASQRVEVRLGCKILNTMTALGIPDGEMIG